MLYPLGLGAYDRPDIGRKDHHGDISAGDILLKNKVLVAGDERVETCLLRFIEQLPVGVGGPAHFGGRAHVMAHQNAAHAPWGVLVEQNPHPFEGVPILANRKTPLTHSRGSSNISVAISSAVHPALALSTTA